MVSKDFNKITLVCITMRFKCSSVAMRRKRCMSSALWCVMKSRASAPPMSAFITGVSISMYPR